MGACELVTYTRQCRQCDQAFATPHFDKLYCSQRCREKRKYTPAPKRRVVVAEKPVRIVPMATCQQCGGEFKARKGKKFCGQKCSNAAFAAPPLELTCKTCTKAFTTLYPNTLYCCEGCRKGRNRPRATPKCRRCGIDFEGMRHQRYCSRKCRMDEYLGKQPAALIQCSACPMTFHGPKNGRFCSALCKRADVVLKLKGRKYTPRAKKVRTAIPQGPRVCRDCGEGFMGHTAKLCSHCANGQHKKYGITGRELRALRDATGNRCYLCGRKEADCHRQLAIDHCHKTGTVRGLLCSQCNVGIGSLQDSPSLLRKAAKYLEQLPLKLVG